MTVFFRMLTGLVVVGLYHALLLLPACLSLLPSIVLPAISRVECTTVPADESELPCDDNERPPAEAPSRTGHRGDHDGVAVHITCSPPAGDQSSDRGLSPVACEAD